MLCRVFYHLSALAEEIPSSRPVDLPAGQVWRDLVAYLQDAEDYVGLLDAADNALQIMLDSSENAYWVELPIPEEHVSYGQRMSEEQVKHLLERLPSRFIRASFPDFESRRWASAR